MTKYRIVEYPERTEKKFSVQYWCPPEKRFFGLLRDAPGFWTDCAYYYLLTVPLPSFDTLEEAKAYVAVQRSREDKRKLPVIVHDCQ